MKVISFLNRKGGTGKTTNAINIAAQLNLQCINGVCLIETDNAYTLRELRSMEVNDLGNGDRELGLKLIQTEQSCVVKLVTALQRQADYDYVIIDGAANMPGNIVADIAGISDLVLIPTATSISEIMVTRHTLRDMTASLDRVMLLPCRIHFAWI